MVLRCVFSTMFYYMGYFSDRNYDNQLKTGTLNMKNHFEKIESRETSEKWKR